MILDPSSPNVCSAAPTPQARSAIRSSASSKSSLLLASAALALAALVGGCKTEHKIETHNVVEIKPIYARIDVYLKIEKELDNFFDFEKTIQPNTNPTTPPGTPTTPTTPPTP